MLNLPPPTRNQQRVLDYIARHQRTHGRSPTAREIAAHFGWASENAARVHVRLLIKKGWLTKDPGVARGVRLVGGAGAPGYGAPPLRRVPLVGAVPAGKPLDAVENLEGRIGIDPALFPDAGVFALRVRGESMKDAGIRDGDLALVRQTPDANDGDIVVAVIDGEATLKRFFRKNGAVVLHAENKAFKDIVVGADADAFSLSGVVVGIIRKMA